jgi:hypothetical protein
MTGLYGGGTINLASGAVVTRTGELTLEWTAAGAGYTWESDVMFAMPASDYGITVPANAVAIAGNDNYSTIPVSEATGTFVTELMAGNSYRLCIRLRRPIFAKSNIYWDATLNDGEGALTFVPAGSSDDTKQLYQGVFFKYGSLVGISPASNFSKTSRVYVPVVKDPLNTSTWKDTKGEDTGSDLNIHSDVRRNFTTTANIPHLDGTYPDGATYAMDAERNTLGTYQKLTGDICQYLSTKTGVVNGDYRLPVLGEFGLWSGWAFSSSGGTGGNAAGMATMNFRAVYATMDNLTLPASGWIHPDLLRYVGVHGCFWTACSAGAGDQTWGAKSYCVWYDNTVNGMRLVYADYSGYSCSVRCVKK